MKSKKAFAVLALVLGTVAAVRAQEPKITVSYSSCTMENGVTDEMLAQFRAPNGTRVNTSLTLNNVSNEDLKKVASLKDVLESLSFWDKGAQITDLAPVAELQKLKTLQIRNCENLADLAPIAKLQTLETLDLYALKNVTDLAPVGKLANLKTLSMAVLGAPIDLAPLGALANLVELRISQSVAYANFEFMRTLANLQKANFLAEPKDVVDLSPMAGLTKLKELTFSQANIADISPLAGMADLEKLALNSSSIADLTPLANMKKLKTLELAYLKTPNLDLTPIGELSELTFLNISSSTFSNYEALAKCQKLESLQAQGTSNFADLSVLSGLPNFKRLGVGGNKSIQDWSALPSLTQLESFQAASTSFSDLALLAKMDKLREFGVQECALVNFEAIAALPSLTNINVTDATGIADISALKTLPLLGRSLVTHKTGQFPQEQVDALKAARDAANAPK